MKLCKLLLTALGATVVLGALVSTASAGRLESSSQTLRANFTSVRFQMPEGIVDCQVTLSGSLHSRTISKVPGTLIGFINDARLGPCVNPGTATILTETLPWHVRYLSFSGTLPNITRLVTNVIGSAFRVRYESFLACLGRSTVERPATGTYERNTATGELTGVTIGGAIPTSCFFNGTFSSSAPVPTSSTGARITVRLI
jgi:hypothetical protein